MPFPVKQNGASMTRQDYDTYDYLVAMDRSNLRDMARFVGNDPLLEVSLLMSYTSTPHDVARPVVLLEISRTHGGMYWQVALTLLERLCQ